MTTIVFSAHLADKFSGGRYHSWFLVEALAALGEDVHVVSDAEPRVRSEFGDYSVSGSITLHVENDYKFARLDGVKRVFVVPDLRMGGKVFVAAQQAVLEYDVPCYFLDFESPNWFSAVSGYKRPLYRTFWWRVTSFFCSFVVSSTELGSRYASHYYKPRSQAASFQVCAPCINDLAMSSNSGPRQSRVVFMYRGDRNDRHKGQEFLTACARAIPFGFSLTIFGALEPEVKGHVEEVLERSGAKLEIVDVFSDKTKFEIFQSACALVFLSRFEGFGLPPVEALASGAKVITFPLEVFEETLVPQGTIHVKSHEVEDLANELSDAITECAVFPLEKHVSSLMLQKYGFQTFVARVARLISNESSVLPLSLKDRFFLTCVHGLCQTYARCISIVRGLIR